MKGIQSLRLRRQQEDNTILYTKLQPSRLQDHSMYTSAAEKLDSTSRCKIFQHFFTNILLKLTVHCCYN